MQAAKIRKLVLIAEQFMVSVTVTITWCQYPYIDKLIPAASICYPDIPFIINTAFEVDVFFFIDIKSIGLRSIFRLVRYSDPGHK